MRTQLIGLCGAAGAGKSTVATHLAENYNGRRLRLADGLKKMLRAIGLTEAQVDGDEKMVPLDLICGNTPRYAMTSLGTGWGRDMIGADFWVNVCAMEITKALIASEHDMLIVDDIRHQNEAEMIQRMGGQVWLVRRPEVEPSFALGARLKRTFHLAPRLHESETLWRKLEVDQVLMNTGEASELKFAASRLLHYARGDYDGPD
jgi:hypothetical protein